MMKLHVLGPVVAMLATAMITGCSPGASSGAAVARGPVDVFQEVDAELAHAVVGTTTVTSATVEKHALPESRMPVRPLAASDDDTPPTTQTWGASAPRSDEKREEYGF